MRLFFGRSQAKSSPTDAIIRLRETLLMLEKRENFLQTKIDNELNIAKVNATKNKRAALMALKRKKQYETQIEKISGSRMTIETQVMAIESANVNLETMNAMRAGSDAMKNIHGEVNIDHVDATMEDIREQMDLANEITDAISQPVAFGYDIDEDELNAELEELEQEELDTQLMGAEAPPVHMPAVPNQPIRNRVQEDEDSELAELRASMAI